MSPKMVRPKECIWQLVEHLTILARQRKGKANGKGESKGKGTKGLGHGKNKGHSFGL